MKTEIKEGAFIYSSKDEEPYKLIGVITEDGLNIFVTINNNKNEKKSNTSFSTPYSVSGVGILIDNGII